MIGQKVTLTIIDTGHNGEGIAKLNNLTVFVESVIIGEVIEAIITKVKKNYAEAKVIKVIEPSSIRITPPCQIYFKCGGCDLQHIKYSEQLKIKQNAVKNTLSKQLSVPFSVNPVIESDKQFAYRNKVQLPIGLINNKVVVGFYKKNSHDIVPLTKCPLHDDWMDLVVSAFLTYANNNNVSVYNENTHAGILRHLVIRNINGVLTIVVVINGSSLPNKDSLINELNNVLKEFTWSLYINKNLKQTNVIMGNELKLLNGTETFTTNVLGLNINVNPFSFFQVNDYISKLIYEKTILQVSGENNVVIDAYSGAGLLTTLIAKHVKKAIGIEIIPEAVNDANLLKELNKINNVTNYCGDVKTTFPSIIKKLSLTNSEKLIVVLDPPRKGCDKEVLETVKKAQPEEIIYISCNPATLARDLAELCNDNSYKINFIQPYDMFPQTKHVETVVFMTRI